jgi:hypothetical protein
MMKKGDVTLVADDDDNEMRTSASQKCAIATLCTEELILRAQYVHIALPLYHQRSVGGSRI